MQRQCKRRKAAHIWLDYLPLDITKKIALYLSYRGVCRLCEVSARLRQIKKDWRFWRDKASVDFGFPRDGFPQSIDMAVARYTGLRKLDSDLNRSHVGTIGMFRIVRYSLIESHQKWDDSMTKYLVGKLSDILDTFDYNDSPDTIQSTLSMSLEGSCVPLIALFSRYFARCDYPLSSHSAYELGKYGYDEFSSELFKQIPAINKRFLLNGAAFRGNLELVVHLLSEGIISNNFMNHAARGKQSELIKYLLEHNIMQSDGPNGILLEAIRVGSVDILVQAINHGADDLDSALQNLLCSYVAKEAYEMGRHLINCGADPYIILDESYEFWPNAKKLKTFAKEYIDNNKVPKVLY